MNLIVGEPIHITSEDLKPADAADIFEAILTILNFQDEPPNEEKDDEWEKNTQEK